jgi:hypothetical protein
MRKCLYSYGNGNIKTILIEREVQNLNAYQSLKNKIKFHLLIVLQKNIAGLIKEI